ncbi:Predicted transcriptional regulator [Mycoplasmopsis caviae]|nr:Predicted transcriptional regulator [Mycoplasmopsis caviae]
MALNYDGLWKLLDERKYNKTILRQLTGLSHSTVAKLTKGENITTDVLERICNALNCKIEEIVKVVDSNDTFKFSDPYISNCKSATSMSNMELFKYYNKLNENNLHSSSRDDICTPMECVKLMIDYIPDELWNRKNIKVLDPCCGNGNFGAYCKTKINEDSIFYNEINEKRLKNCIKILSPKNWSCRNAFDFVNDHNLKFDLVMANLPYSGGGNKNQSLSNNFIELGIDLLNDKGYLCYVTPNNWMSYNNNNTTLKKLLKYGSFIVIDNDIKKYFNGVGSSFTVFIWQKGVFNNKTKVINNFLIKDVKENVIIPNDMNFLPLYLSNEVISIAKKIVGDQFNKFTYRCDLHNFTKKDSLSDTKNKLFKYRTIHTARKTRYATIKQDIYDKWIIIVPLSTYFIPYIEHKTNTTQSVGYLAFETENEANEYIKVITQPHFKLLIHLTRYGNFNNIKVLKHLRFGDQFKFSEPEIVELNKLVSQIKY